LEYWTELLTFDLSSDRMTGEKARDMFASNGEPPAHSNLFDSMAERPRREAPGFAGANGASI
jgi:hypothetical protein